MKVCHLLLLLACALPFAGCTSSAPASVSAAAPPARPAPAAPAATANDDYETSGPLVVENQVDVLAQRDGVIAELLADAGTRVEKNQQLARLDDRQLRAEYEAAQAHLQSMYANRRNFDAENKVLESDLQRSEELFKAGVFTHQQVEHARYTLEAARHQTEREQHYVEETEAKLRAMKIEMEKGVVSAPFAGVVARRYTRLGQKVTANDRMFWVTATAPIKVQFTLPEFFAGRIENGQKISVFSPATPDVAHVARVTMVSPVVDPASATIDVQAQLESPSSDLRPGMTATVRVKKSR
jgi:membrane fusion protein (multidrug efflux system)